MFPYNQLSAIISSSFYFVHIIGFLYIFVACNLRSSHSPSKSYLKQWYEVNYVVQSLLTIAFIPEVLWSFFNGWHYSVCVADTLYTGPLSGTVVTIWTISKLSDLAETFLLIVDSRRPLPIHIFHHFVSLSYAFTFYALGFAVHRWIIFFNLGAHVILYAYLSETKILDWTPCWASVFFSQMLQLILPFIATLSVTTSLARGYQCDATSIYLLELQIGLIVLIIVFADFYYSRIKTYRRKMMKKMKREEDSPKKSPVEKISAKKPSDETVLFEKDFPDLRSVIFSPE